MRPLQIPFFLILILLMKLEVQSQEHAPRALTWFQYKGAGSLKSGKWGAMLDVQHRRAGFLRTSSQQLIRPGVTLELADQLFLTVGVASFWHNISTDDSQPLYRYEARPFQFVQWQQSFTKLRLRHKFRLEQRFNRKTMEERIIPGFDFNYRTGYRLSILYPVVENWVITAYDEILINFGKEITTQYLDQNRVYLGIRIKNNQFTYKTGYMWLTAPMPESAGFEHSHIVRMGVSHRW